MNRRWLPVTGSIDDVDLHGPLLAPTVAFAAGAVVLRFVGLPPVDLHPPLHRLGLMDPLCGGTRATLALSHGDVPDSWAYNPLVPLLAVAVALVALRWVTGCLTGRWINVYVRQKRVLLVCAALMVAVLWVNQQRHAELLAFDVPSPTPGIGRPTS